MQTKRLIHLITLPFALALMSGCVERSTVDLSTDPAAVPDQLLEGDRVRIEGYSLASGFHVEWSGHVSFVPPDSLYFDPGRRSPRPKPATFGGHVQPDQPDHEPFTVPIESVRTLHVVDVDNVTPVVLALPLMVTTITLMAAISYGSSGIYGR